MESVQSCIRCLSQKNILDDREFAILLDIVMNSEELATMDKKAVTKVEMVSQILEHIHKDEDDSIILIEFLLDKLHIIMKRKPNKKQTEAFLDDLQDIYNHSCRVLSFPQGEAFDIPLEEESEEHRKDFLFINLSK